MPGSMIPGTESGKTVLVDFYAPWCTPCQWLEPILEEVGKQLDGKAEILKIDIDQYPALAEQFDVKSVPTLILFAKGEVKWRMAGFLLAPELVKIIKEYS